MKRIEHILNDGQLIKFTLKDFPRDFTLGEEVEFDMKVYAVSEVARGMGINEVTFKLKE
jgi:hypothetical protein